MDTLPDIGSKVSWKNMSARISTTSSSFTTTIRRGKVIGHEGDCAIVKKGKNEIRVHHKNLTLEA